MEGESPCPCLLLPAHSFGGSNHSDEPELAGAAVRGRSWVLYSLPNSGIKLCPVICEQGSLQAGWAWGEWECARTEPWLPGRSVCALCSFSHADFSFLGGTGWPHPGYGPQART